MRKTVVYKHHDMFIMQLLVVIFFMTSSSSVFAEDVIKNINSSDTKPALTMAIFPRRNTKVTVRFFTPLTEYLSKELNREVRLIVSKDFKSFWSGVVNKSYDIVHYNQYHYLESHKKFNYHVIAKNVEFGHSTIAGAVIVRKDSGINSVADLKGKKIAFGGGPKAMQGYIVARYLLEKAGLSDTEYKSLFAKNPPNAVFSTYYNKTAAAGAGDKVLSLGVVKKRIKTKELKYLLKGDALPHLPWAVSGLLSETLRNKIQKLLVNLVKTEAGVKILKASQLDGLEMVTDKEYDKHREIVYEVLGRQL